MLIRGLFPGLLVLLLVTQLQAATVRVQAIRIAQNGDETRVVLDLDQTTDHQLFTLSDPHRVVVDLSAGTLTEQAARFPDGKGLVSRIRGANRSDGSTRIVLDLGQPVRPRSFIIGPDGEHGHRLVVDLVPLDQQVVVKTVPDKLGNDRDLVIAVDPGHGGKDPGARGRSGLLEKDAVLQISRRLARKIDQEPGMRAALTRKNDSFIHLRERMERAHRQQADLFISIHADAFRDQRVRGATVYVLSNKGATDEAARRLAERENAADLVGGVTLKDKDQMLASVLIDLSQNASLSSSMDVGDQVLDELRRIGKIRKPQVQQAPFIVLKSPDIPSMLIETAFISNRYDESNLGSVQYQERLAQAIFAGVRHYF
ncbi:MAG: N-acetylmuramoyl-L-alanine amidase, partial [Gammaproteobacteria bacterium]